MKRISISMLCSYIHHANTEQVGAAAMLYRSAFIQETLVLNLVGISDDPGQSTDSTGR